MAYDFTNQKQVRIAFWEGWEYNYGTRPKRLKDGDYPVDVRVAFVDFVDALEKGGHISEALAQRVTL